MHQSLMRNVHMLLSSIDAGSPECSGKRTSLTENAPLIVTDLLTEVKDLCCLFLFINLMPNE